MCSFVFVSACCFFMAGRAGWGSLVTQWALSSNQSSRVRTCVVSLIWVNGTERVNHRPNNVQSSDLHASCAARSLMNINGRTRWEAFIRFFCVSMCVHTTQSSLTHITRHIALSYFRNAFSPKMPLSKNASFSKNKKHNKKKTTTSWSMRNHSLYALGQMEPEQRVNREALQKRDSNPPGICVYTVCV